MGVLEEVIEMQNQGIPEGEIANTLQQRGISPGEIANAINQSQIKSAVAGEEMQDMQPSIMDQEQAPPPQEEAVPMQTAYEPQNPETYAPQQQYSDQAYYQGPVESYTTAGGTDTMIEISEQVFSEKTKSIQKDIENLIEFKTLAETKIENISERLKRMETTIDRLQISILDKVGSYGGNLNAIKKEMAMMQDSFGKIVNQAVSKKSSKKTSKR